MTFEGKYQTPKQKQLRHQIYKCRYNINHAKKTENLDAKNYYEVKRTALIGVLKRTGVIFGKGKHKTPLLERGGVSVTSFPSPLTVIKNE